METIKLSKDSTIIRKNGKYYYHKYNPYTGGQDITDIIFDKSGKSEIRTGNQCYWNAQKEKIDIMFELQKENK